MLETVSGQGLLYTAAHCVCGEGGGLCDRGDPVNQTNKKQSPRPPRCDVPWSRLTSPRMRAPPAPSPGPRERTLVRTSRPRSGMFVRAVKGCPCSGHAHDARWPSSSWHLKHGGAGLEAGQAFRRRCLACCCPRMKAFQNKQASQPG